MAPFLYFELEGQQARRFAVTCGRQVSVSGPVSVQICDLSAFGLVPATIELNGVSGFVHSNPGSAVYGCIIDWDMVKTFKELDPERDGSTPDKAILISGRPGTHQTASSSPVVKERQLLACMGLSEWHQLSTAAGIKLEPIVPQVAKCPRYVPAFSWEGEPDLWEQTSPTPERKYVQLLKEHIPLPATLAWVYGWQHWSLLAVQGKGDLLHYDDIWGTPHAAIVTRASYDVCLPSGGLCVSVYVRKPPLMHQAMSKWVYCAAVQAVLANVLCPGNSPVVVMTDLVDHWQLFWMDGSKVVTSTCSSRAHAMGVIDGLVQAAAERASGSSDIKAAVLPPALANRRPAVVGGRVQAVGSLHAGPAADVAAVVKKEDDEWSMAGSE